MRVPRVGAAGRLASPSRVGDGARARARRGRATASGPARPSRPGDDYRFVLDGRDAWPDPCSRCQPEASAARRASSIPPASSIAPGRSSGSTSSSSTSSTSARSRPRARSTASIPRLAGLRELGVTAIELMPVATFPGERGWGYDGLYTFAPHPAYGGPEGLARLVDAAHREGLGVILDVVYNHVGPGNEALRALRPVLHRPLRRDTVGRRARLRASRRPRVGAPERRALGARLPDRRAAARRRPRRPGRLAAARARRARRAGARRRPARARDQRDGAGRLPAAARVGSRRDVARRPPPRAARRADRRAGRLLRGLRRLDGRRSPRELERPEGPRLVVCAQNHDQVGNRALGDRLPRAKLLRVAQAVVLFSPFTPLLFQGEEYGERRRSSSSPTTSTRSSRRRPARAGGASSPRFAGFRGEVPDPQAAETFERSRLEPTGDAPIALRRRAAAPAPRAAARARGPRVDEARARRSSCAAATATLRADFALTRSSWSYVKVWPGKPFPLGPKWDGEGTNFSLFSEHAERVELCLFDADGPRDAATS